ncbi:MAG: hypothetical protein JXN61_09755 [Sedimentisphaerales bacterium]|nr:hypothetical protein [Sedimentisphaerales bacterium]
MNREYNRLFSASGSVTWLVLLMLSLSQAVSQTRSGLAKHDISLKGHASGGVLTLTQTLNRNVRHISVTTKSGEPAEDVAVRLADAINLSDPFEWNEGIREGKYYTITSKEGSLTLPGSLGRYVFAGTERGLGIPEAPQSLSCTYSPKDEQVLLQWANPQQGYDVMALVIDGSTCISCSISGSANRHILDWRGRATDSVDIWLIGSRNGVPSNAAAIHLSDKSQDELFGIPFTGVVAPNWTTFTIGAPNAVQFEQGVREMFLNIKGQYNGIKHPATKPFYQLIKIASPDAIGGVKRKFLGLTPGHTYSVSARLSTLEMDAAVGEWSVSLHSTYNQPGGADLTSEQLSGLAMLPDGSKGAEAGRIAFYGPELTTKGTWEERSTGKEWRGTAAPDIVLPLGCDTITVWLRCRGVGSFGIDWVKIEDLQQSN